MSRTLVLWLVAAVLCLVLLVRSEWRCVPAVWFGRLRLLPWKWVLLGFPLTVFRMLVTWQRLADNAGLSVDRRHRRGLVFGDVVVQGRALRPLSPRLGLPRPLRSGLRVRVFLHPGQTPAAFIEAADAMAHAWRVHAVRVTAPVRGEVLVRVLAGDPLAADAVDAVRGGTRSVRPLLCARVGRFEDGGSWLVDLRRVPHWLVIGATRSGKSNWLAAFVRELAPQALALVGIDCKGGMELSLMGARLSALATNRDEAVVLLDALLSEAGDRMAKCRAAGVRSVWELPPESRFVPVVCLVDELAELYLTDGSAAGKRAAAECSTALLRLAQLGAALGMHLVVAGQRIGSELGPGVTALRAQLGGRVCHAVNDPGTAEMALGDLAPDAVEVAQGITEDQPGVAVTTVGGRWLRARSTFVSTEESRLTAERYSSFTPELPGLAGRWGGEDT